MWTAWKLKKPKSNKILILRPKIVTLSLLCVMFIYVTESIRNRNVSPITHYMIIHRTQTTLYWYQGAMHLPRSTGLFWSSSPDWFNPKQSTDTLVCLCVWYWRLNLDVCSLNHVVLALLCMWKNDKRK